MSRKVLQVKGYSPDQIKKLFNKDEKYKTGMRLYTVYQVSKGQSTRKLEELCNSSFKQICNWVHRFEQEGLKGLKDKPKSGKPSRLSSEQKKELKMVLHNNKPSEFGYNKTTWTGPLLMEYIKSTYGIEYSKAQTYNIIKEFGFTKNNEKSIYQ